MRAKKRTHAQIAAATVPTLLGRLVVVEWQYGWTAGWLSGADDQGILISQSLWEGPPDGKCIHISRIRKIQLADDWMAGDGRKAGGRDTPRASSAKQAGTE